MTEATLETIRDGVMHFTDGSTLPVPAGATAEWESNPWHSAWVFKTPAARQGKAFGMIISTTGTVSRGLAERAMAWLREQPSMQALAQS